MSNVTVSMKMSAKAAGALYMKSITQEGRIDELEKQNAKLVKECDELNKQCGEFQEGFFEYMGLCDHLQIEVDNLKKKIINLTTPDVSKKSGCNL